MNLAEAEKIMNKIAKTSAYILVRSWGTMA